MVKYCILVMLLLPPGLSAQTVVINEVMASNHFTLNDEDGDASDYIELYNASAAAVNLSGYALSDDTLKAHKWLFGNTIIAPGAHLIIFASSKDRKVTHLHTNFNVSASGESIVLCDASGSAVDRVDVPASPSDVSYARLTDASPRWVFQTGSPGAVNTGKEMTGFADAIVPSPAAGFFPSAISVTLSAGPSAIFYTLDGNDPDSTSTHYTGPIAITKTCVLKATSIKAGYSPTPALHQTYFINVSTDLPVVSLSSAPRNLFDYNYGIFANGPGWTAAAPNYGANFWKDWERPAHIEFFDDAKQPGFSENCIVAIHGAYTRSYAQKSLSVKFKNEVGASAINYRVFPDLDLSTFKSLILRNSGNDFMYVHFRDAMMQRLIRDLDIDYQEYRPATAFINGEYWGIYNIREKINEHYIATRHGVDPDNIDMLENNMAVIHGDSLHYLRLINYISTHDMTTDEAYAYVDSTIDLDECLLYFAAQVYYNSQDWPANNIKFWRERSEKGKWRWILFDLDFGFNLYETTGQSENHLSYLLSGFETRPGSNPPWSTLLPRKLVENPVIKKRFINLIADLLNTKFESTRVVSIINAMAAHIANEIPKHRARFNIKGENLDRMTSFAKDRPVYLRGFVRNFFMCGSNGTITVSAGTGGKVKLNTVFIDKAMSPWTGTYFQDNAVQCVAIPDPGYRFAGWSGSVPSTKDTVSLNAGASTTLAAAFVPGVSAGDEIVINEINYNSAAAFDPADWIELYNRGSRTANIGSWKFSDSDSTHTFVIPAGTQLDPDHYLVLAENATAFAARFPAVKNYFGGWTFGLDGAGEFMRLTNAAGGIVDSLTYDDKAPWPTSPDGNGTTLELADAVSDNAQAVNWKASSGHGTPGAVNSVRTSVSGRGGVVPPDRFALSQNYPNPFNPSTMIGYALPSPAHVTLAVYDMLGRTVATLVDRRQDAGAYNAAFDASGLPAGIYIARLHAGAETRSIKLTLLK